MSSIRTFYLLTITQVCSLIGSLMTSTALGIRIFNDTGNSTPLLLASFFAALPLMIGGIFAGVFADRWQRRYVLILSDTGQAIGTLLLLISFASGEFQLWHLYLVSFLQGTLGTFQRPAMEASVTMLVPDNHRDRANAIRQITGPTAGMIAPVVTGLIYASVGVIGVMLIDLLTFVVAVTTVYLVRIPQPRSKTPDRQPSIWHEAWSGFQYVWSRRVLFVLMLYATMVNFLLAGPITLTTPYIITLTDSETILGVLLGLMNVGIVVGGLVMSVWGGTRPRIHGIMLGLLVRASMLVLYGVADAPLTLGIALFFVFFTNALIDASFMSIMQLKVPPPMQGRVFALLFQMMQLATPLSLLITGPLVDRLLEPAVGSPLWTIVTPIVGEQRGAGMGLLMVIAGCSMFFITLVVYSHPKVRRLENDLPDYKGTPDVAKV
ncbi:MAG: MFS transporter [Chloroflexota bacterium]